MISSIFTNSNLYIDLSVHYGQVGCGVSKSWVHHLLDIIEKMTKIGYNYKKVCTSKFKVLALMALMEVV